MQSILLSLLLNVCLCPTLDSTYCYLLVSWRWSSHRQCFDSLPHKPQSESQGPEENNSVVMKLYTKVLKTRCNTTKPRQSESIYNIYHLLFSQHFALLWRVVKRANGTTPMRRHETNDGKESGADWNMHSFMMAVSFLDVQIVLFESSA